MCAEAVARIAELYAAEEEARGKPPDERIRIRQDEARIVSEAFRSRMKTQLLRISTKSDPAAAIRYALARLPELEVYLSNGRLEIENNAAERGIRGPTLGRKNSMFLGSEGGGATAAVAYTLIETAKLNDIDPQAWLSEVLTRVGTHPDSQIDHLLPWNHKA